MKNLTLLFFALFTSFLMAQPPMVVTDVKANAQLKTQLVNSGKQLAQLQRSYELLKDAQDKYQEINSYVSSINDISDIISMQKEAIENVNLIVKNTKRKGESRELLMTYLNRILLDISKSVGVVSNVLSEGYFSMDDKDRIDLFQAERDRVFSLLASTRGKANPYK